MANLKIRLPLLPSVRFFIKKRIDNYNGINNLLTSNLSMLFSISVISILKKHD